MNGTPISLALVPGRAVTGVVSGAAAISTSAYAVFSPPTLASATAVATTFPVVQVVSSSTSASGGSGLPTGGGVTSGGGTGTGTGTGSGTGTPGGGTGAPGGGFTGAPGTGTGAPGGGGDAVGGSAVGPVSANALEGPLTQVTGAGKASVPGRTLVVDPATNTAYALTVSGLSLIPLSPTTNNPPLPNAKGAVNLASYETTVAAGGLLSIFGQNLGTNDTFSATPLPLVLGGTCVTLNNVPLPLFWVSPGQINAEIPPGMAPGTYPLVVRSIANRAASPSQTLTISATAPAVLVDGTGQVALIHADGQYVTVNNPAVRDEPLELFAVGLGATTGATVTAGMPSPSGPLAVTASTVAVYFGDPSYKQAAIIVDWSGLAPGFVGVYQIDIRVPGFHNTGNALPVTLKVGSVESPTNGPVVPQVAVQ